MTKAGLNILILIFVSTINSHFLLAQSISPFVLSSAGNHATVVGIQISYTVGEPITTTRSNNTNTITHGFHQPSNDSLLISGDSDSLIAIYNGITPNGDGYNDFWVIDGIDTLPDNLVIIFNRWGEKVWHGEKYNNSTVAWNGNNQSGDKLPSGTYFYTITLKRKSFKGWVELTR